MNSTTKSDAFWYQSISVRYICVQMYLTLKNNKHIEFQFSLFFWTNFFFNEPFVHFNRPSPLVEFSKKAVNFLFMTCHLIRPIFFFARFYWYFDTMYFIIECISFFRPVLLFSKWDMSFSFSTTCWRFCFNRHEVFQWQNFLCGRPFGARRL